MELIFCVLSVYTRVWIDICFHFDFHNICDLFEIIENRRKYSISEKAAENTALNFFKFAIVELL